MIFEWQADAAEVPRPLRSWRRGVSSRVGIAVEESRYWGIMTQDRGIYDTGLGEL